MFLYQLLLGILCIINNWGHSSDPDFSRKIFDESKTFKISHNFDDNDKIFVDETSIDGSTVSLIKNSNIEDSHTIMISCKRKNLDVVQNLLLEMSDLNNIGSKKKMTHYEVQKLTYSPESIMYVLQYLRSLNISINEKTFTGNVITATRQ